MKISLLNAQPLDLPKAAATRQADSSDSGFAKLLKEQIVKADHLQKEADFATERMLAGEDVELHQAMLATEQAELAMQLVLQIRNKLLEAYQELSRMQI